MSKAFTWSYTRWRDWENCPRQYEWKHEQKHREPPSEEQLWGDRVHKALDERAKGVELPAGMEHLERLGEAIDRAKEIGIKVYHEKDSGQVAFDRNLTLTSWFAPNVWGRVVWDLSLVADSRAVIIDYKTGKKRDDHRQLMLAAAVGFIKFPAVQTIETRYVWTNGAAPTIKVYERRDAPWAWNEILPAIERMETGVAKKQFDPRPSGLCGYCPVKSCEHNTNNK